MKKIILLLFLLCFCSFAIADESDDIWNNYNVDITGGKEVRAVSDEEFEKALEQMDAKVNKWKNRYRKWSAPRGKEFSQSNETELIKNEHGEDVSLPVLSVPVEIIIGDGILPVGHYQVKGEKIDDKPVLNLYQAGELMTRISAIETKEDYDKEEILFADWIAQGDDKIKIIYGSLDFNAYAIVNISQ